MRAGFKVVNKLHPRGARFIRVENRPLINAVYNRGYLTEQYAKRWGMFAVGMWRIKWKEK